MSVQLFDTSKNYLKISNYLVDEVMPSISANAWRVLCYMVRQTKGWGRDWVGLTYGEIMDGTGIGSKSTLSKALSELKDEGYITEKPSSNWRPNTYALNIHKTVDGQIRNDGIPPSPASTETVPLPSTETVPLSDDSSTETVPLENDSSTENGPDSGTETVRYIKNRRKKKKEEEDPANAGPPPPTADDEKEQTPQQKYFGKICDIVGWNYKTLTDEQQGQVAQTVGILQKADYTQEDLERFGTEVWAKDWRWQKHKSHPTLSQLRAEIGKLKSDKGIFTASQPSRNGSGNRYGVKEL